MKRLNAVPTDRVHLWLMLALTFSTGVVDAVGYLGLDRVFTGNMTGNVVLLGMAFAGGADLPILRPALALVFFMLGAALAGRMLRKGPDGWSWHTSVALTVVAAGLTALAVFVAVADVRGNEILGSLTTSTMAAVMGVQAATAKRLKVAEITTVVVTSTITGLAADSKLAGGGSQYWQRRALAVALILLGALAGAAALKVDLWLGLAISAAISIAVAVAGYVRHHRERGADAAAAPEAG
ncbi:YoaK family protein [Arthrobacter sp. ATA002]|uniref:YoaK family protein n=1 Tax=Arthrobacter sp. ATA002 TaxID=2991715 RepID=UPI0022A7B152|nr:YoaK family protein [Arthrobacter sp. ATA002]WAP51341.1 YoaK family protein [Arthrobacter sp. ATA002]